MFAYINAYIANSGNIPTEIVSGGAAGVDALGEAWAYKYNIPVRRFQAQWTLYGKSAGPIRNAEMADYADALLAIWDGKSTGTKHMIHCMYKRGKPRYTEFYVE